MCNVWKIVFLWSPSSFISTIKMKWSECRWPGCRGNKAPLLRFRKNNKLELQPEVEGYGLGYQVSSRRSKYAVSYQPGLKFSQWPLCGAPLHSFASQFWLKWKNIHIHINWRHQYLMANGGLTASAGDTRAADACCRQNTAGSWIMQQNQLIARRPEFDRWEKMMEEKKKRKKNAITRMLFQIIYYL